MSSKPTLHDLRDAIEATIKQMMENRVDGEVSIPEIVEKFRTTNKEKVEFFSSQLINSALNKLVHDACKRKKKASAHMGGDLFGEYPGIPISITVHQGSTKDIFRTNIRELDAYINNHTKKKINKRALNIKKLLDDHRHHFLSDEDTLEIAMNRKRESEKTETLEIA